MSARLFFELLALVCACGFVDVVCDLTREREDAG